MKKRISFALLALCFIVGAVQALPLPTGGVVAPLPLQAPGPGPIISATLVSPYNIGGTFVGTATSWAVLGDPANPFGGISFYYQVNNTGTEAAGRFTTSSFGVVPLDVATIAAPWDGALPGGFAPQMADRSVAGDVVGFEFLGAGQIPGGAWSEVMVVHTPLSTFTMGIGAVIDNRGANVDVLALIPEPATIALLGFGAMAFLRKRSK